MKNSETKEGFEGRPATGPERKSDYGPLVRLGKSTRAKVAAIVLALVPTLTSNLAIAGPERQGDSEQQQKEGGRAKRAREKRYNRLLKDEWRGLIDSEKAIEEIVDELDKEQLRALTVFVEELKKEYSDQKEALMDREYAELNEKEKNGEVTEEEYLREERKITDRIWPITEALSKKDERSTLVFERAHEKLATMTPRRRKI